MYKWIVCNSQQSLSWFRGYVPTLRKTMTTVDILWLDESGWSSVSEALHDLCKQNRTWFWRGGQPKTSSLASCALGALDILCQYNTESQPEEGAGQDTHSHITHQNWLCRSDWQATTHLLLFSPHSIHRNCTGPLLLPVSGFLQA